MNHSLYSELLSSLQIYLKEEFPKGHLISAESETFEFFRQEAKDGKGKKQLKSSNTAPPTPSLIQPAVSSIPKPAIAVTTAVVKEVSKAKTPTLPKKESAPLKIHQAIQIESVAPVIEDNLADIRKQVEALFPGLLLASTPLDTEAKKKKDIWKEKECNIAVLIITNESLPVDHAQFLQSMAKGITERLAPAIVLTMPQILERKLLDSPALKLLITESLPTTQGKLPVVQLKEIGHYISQPSEKRALWQQICQALT